MLSGAEGLHALPNASLDHFVVVGRDHPMHWALEEWSKQCIGDLVALVKVHPGAPVAKVVEPLAAFGYCEGGAW